MYTGTFRAMGNSMLFSLTTTPSVAVQLSTGNVPGARFLSIANGGWFAASNSSGVLVAIPTTATPGNGVPFALANKNFVEAFDIGPKAWVSFGTTNGTAKVHVTPGIGR